jgi:hypothetical protein
MCFLLSFQHGTDFIPRLLFTWLNPSAQDKKNTNQNSGVHIDATNNNGENDTYYGYIEEI